MRLHKWKWKCETEMRNKLRDSDSLYGIHCNSKLDFFFAGGEIVTVQIKYHFCVLFSPFFIYRFHLPFIQLTVKMQIRNQQTELAVHCYLYLFVWSASDEHLHYLNTIRASYKYSITNANTNVYISIDCAPFLRSQWTQICHFICFGMYIYVISSWFLLISFSSLTFIFLFFFIAMARPE